MGQRHQLFVIAKIGHRYRGLATIHHQWLYSSRALQVTPRLRRIFQAPENRLALEQELRWAKRLSEHNWTSDHDTAKPQPFPFITTCMILGASWMPEVGYHHMVHVLPFDIEFNKVSER
jgi:hypothetical protein